MSGHWTTRPAMAFRCGACGTEAKGFVYPSELDQFAEQHAKLCPGFPPAALAAPAAEEPRCLRIPPARCPDPSCTETGVCFEVRRSLAASAPEEPPGE